MFCNAKTKRPNAAECHYRPPKVATKYKMPSGTSEGALTYARLQSPYALKMQARLAFNYEDSTHNLFSASSWGSSALVAFTSDSFQSPLQGQPSSAIIYCSMEFDVVDAYKRQSNHHRWQHKRHLANRRTQNKKLRAGLMHLKTSRRKQSTLEYIHTQTTIGNICILKF